MAAAYLIDTHALLWAADNESANRLGQVAEAVLRDPESRIYASIASLWELSIKVSIGKLEVPEDFFDRVYASGYLKLPIEVRHLDRYRTLPLHHRDPFDRLLVAQAQAEGLRVISHDSVFSSYAVDLVW